MTEGRSGMKNRTEEQEKTIKEKKENQKKQKPVYEPITGILGEASDYHVYHMTVTDRCIAALIGFGVAAIVIYVFFHNIPVMLAAGAVVAFLVQKVYENYKKKKRQKNLLIQFKDLLESLAASYSAGENTQAAFADAREDLISIYGENADIVKEVEQIVSGISNNFTVEKMLENFAKRSGLDDVESFYNVFEVANRQGSSLKQIIADSREIINDKIEIEMEIETMLTGNKNELNIMVLMPLVIVLSMNGMGTMTINSNTSLNVLVKIGCLALFAGSYFMGRKITNIKM